jgi:hypothetical protein
MKSGQIITKPQEIQVKRGAEIGLTVCDYPFPTIAEMPLGAWTRPVRPDCRGRCEIERRGAFADQR